MKVLLLTLEYPPFFGGVANYYGNLVKHWPEPDNIFVLDNSNDKLISKKLPMIKWLPAIWQLYKNIKINKIDHIFVGHVLPLGTVAWMVSKITNVRYSVILHGMDFSFALKSARKKKMSKLILNNAEKIICSNSYTAKLAGIFLGDSSKIAVINPGVENNLQLSINNYQFKEKYKLEGKQILLSVGRLVKRKGFDMVLEALPDVLKQIPDLVYVIIGNGEEQDNYKLSIINYQLQDKVLIITDATDEDKYKWYETCDAFIMPSRNINGDFEGFGIVYLEANLAGKPVIAGDSGGVRDAVEDDINGLLVDSGNKEATGNAIINLMQNPELRKKLGEQGRERALKYFQWEDKIKEIFNTINI